MAQRRSPDPLENESRLRQRALESAELEHRIRRVEFFGRGEMRKDAGDLDLRHARERVERIGELMRLEAEPIEIGVDLDVHRGARLALARARAEPARELAGVPEHDLNVRRECVVERLRRNRPEHEQCGRDAAGSQRERFFDRIDAETRRKRFDRARYREQSVTVRIPLHDEGGALRADEIAQQRGVMTQRAQRDAQNLHG